MANSNTEHSRSLRIKTSEAWKKDNQKRLYITLVKKDWDLLERFQKIPGDTSVEKFRLLIQKFYENS